MDCFASLAMTWGGVCCCACRLASVDKNHYSRSKQIEDCINHQGKNPTLLINNYECIQKVKEQMDDSTVNQISVLSENVSHNNAYTYDSPHKGNCINYQIQWR